MIQQSSDPSTPLAERVAEFKKDPENVRQANEFVDLLIQQAKREAELKQKQKDRGKFDFQDTDSGKLKRRLSQARGAVLRVFDVIRNCTQTAAATAAARANFRHNPFAKR